MFDYYNHGFILDEINLASDELLEFLYSILISLYKDGSKNILYKDYNNNDRSYTSPDGEKYEKIGNIGVIGTMNDEKLSNSRTFLSNSFLNLCIIFNLPNYTIDEVELLAENIIKKETNLYIVIRNFLKL